MHSEIERQTPRSSATRAPKPYDERLMALALRLGKRGAGQTNENPSVGCVLIQEKPDNQFEIVGRGFTQPSGRPHAERVALAEAGERAKGATAYVTLEPCSHYGKTSPCSDALIDAGVAHVVCAYGDPDPRVCGGGFTKLQNAGISVLVGACAPQAKFNLRGFLSRTERARPWVQAKLAVSQDGAIGVVGQGNYPVTGPEAKKRTYGYRSQADAILVSIETVLLDDPSLTVRLNGLEHTSPIRVVFDSKGRIPLSCELVQTATQIPTWIIATGAISAEKALTLEARGCKLFLLDADGNGRVDINAALGLLAEEGINTLMVEPGVMLAEALLAANVIDEFLLYKGASMVGPDGLLAFDGQAEEKLTEQGFALAKRAFYGNDEIQTYLKADGQK